MEYPPEVKKYIDFLDNYKTSDDLEIGHIIQMHPEGLAYPNGFYDSQFFTLVLFNTETMEKRTIESRDEIRIKGDLVGGDLIKFVRIFADGSTLIKFNCAIFVVVYQSVDVLRYI